MPPSMKRKPTVSVDLTMEQLAPPPPPPPFLEDGEFEGGPDPNERANVNNDEEEEEDVDYTPGPSQHSRPHSQRKKVQHLPHHHVLLSP